MPAEKISQVKQMISGFIRNTEIEGAFPKDYQWQSTTGKLAQGWTEKEGLSTNRVEYAGDLSTTGYFEKSVDVNTILKYSDIDKSILPAGFENYLTHGMDIGNLPLSISTAYSEAFGHLPNLVNLQSPVASLFAPENKNFENRVWGFLYLLKYIQNKAAPAANIQSNVPASSQIQPVDDFQQQADGSQKYSFFISAILILIATVFIISLLRINSLPTYLMGFYLVFFAQIVLISEVASLCLQLSNQYFFLAGNVFILVLSIIAWFWRGKPALFKPLINSIRKFSPSKISYCFHNYPSIVFFSLCVLVIYIYTAYLIIMVPQNVDDVLTTYLARVGFLASIWFVSSMEDIQLQFPSGDFASKFPDPGFMDNAF